MRYYLLLFLLYFLTTGFANAQEPVPRIVPFTDFVDQRMLKGIEAFDIEVDPRGYTYITSNLGIFKFNGYNLNEDFVLIGSDEKAMSYALHKGYNGDIWTGSRLGRIVHFKGDSIFDFPVPDSIINMGNRGFESVYQDKNKLLHLAPRGYGHYTVDAKGKVREIMSNRTNNIRGFVVTQLDDGSWFHYFINSRRNDVTNPSVYFLSKDGELKEIIKTDSRMPSYESSLVEHPDGSLSLSIGTNTIVKFRGAELISVDKFDFNIIKLFLDSRNDLWIGTAGEGAYLAKNADLTRLTNYFEGNLAAVAESHDGGVWFKSNKIGLGYLPSTSGVHYSSQNGYDSITDIYTTTVINSKVLITTTDWKVYLLDNQRVELLAPEITDLRVGLGGVCYDETNCLYWVYAESELISLKNGKIQHTIDVQNAELKNKRIMYIKSIEGRILGVTRSELFEIKNNELVLLSDGIVNCKLNDFDIDDLGKFWFASDRGIRIMEGRSIKEPSFSIPDELKTVFYSCFFKDNYLWANSYDGSLMRFNRNHGEIVVDQHQIPCKSITFALDEYGVLWGHNIDRARILKLTDLGNPKHVHREEFVVPINESGSVISGGFCVHNGHIFIGSNMTLSITPIDQLLKELPPSKMQFNLFINYEPVPFSNSYELDYFENDIRMEFDAINFSRKNIIFSYMLEGYETKWNETDYKELRYTNLSPGSYRLKFRSKVGTDDWSDAEIITFVIKAPFWQTLSFKLLMIALGLLIVLGIILLRVRSVRKKEREKARNLIEKMNLEMRALKSQLNPHFIFNSISTAMFYISKNENDKAESYLQRFTKLMRGILESSEESNVRLNDEVELMRNYVSLESEQFENEPINFEISYGNVDPDELMIPPIIFQPYIENSIRHGLKTKEGNRTIALSFRKTIERLEVKIIDNGIGRVRARKKDSRRAHKSFGMLISSRRIALLNQVSSSDIVIKDLYDSAGISLGTSVQFTLPLLTLKDK